MAPTWHSATLPVGGSLLGLALLLGTATPIQAQGVLPTLLGGAGGLAAGGFVSAGLEAARSDGEDYRFWEQGPTGWAVAPIAVGTVGGALLGSTNVDRLERAALGAFLGGAVGAGVGWAAGPRMRPAYQSWAGPLIGGAIGMAFGSLVGVVWPAGDDDGRQPPRGPILPLSVTILF